MPTNSLAGHVVVVAANSDTAGVAIALAHAGAAVAVLTADTIDAKAVEESVGAATPLLVYRVDPTAPASWARVAAHIEQRLGPVDAAVTDEASRVAATAALMEDLRRRGHGDVVSIDEADIVAAVSLVVRRKP